MMDMSSINFNNVVEASPCHLNSLMPGKHKDIPMRSPQMYATPRKDFNALMDEAARDGGDYGPDPYYDLMMMEDLEPMNRYEDRLTSTIRNIQLRYIGERGTQ